LPIFSNNEYATLYRNRGGIDCQIVKLQTVTEALCYLESPPTRAEESSVPSECCFAVIDPIEASPGTELSLFKISDLVHSLRLHLKK